MTIIEAVQQLRESPETLVATHPRLSVCVLLSYTHSTALGGGPMTRRYALCEGIRQYPVGNLLTETPPRHFAFSDHYISCNLWEVETVTRAAAR